MTRLKVLSPDKALGKTKDMYNRVHSKLGTVPNMVQTMGNSPALLEGYLNFSTALGGGTLNSETAVLIALTVAESNSCNYCLAVHTYIGENVLKIDAYTLEAARSGNSNDPRTNAILKFAKTLIKKRGLVDDADVNSLKAAGATEAEVAEIIGNVALNIFTNYFNNTAKTEIDFPIVKVLQSAGI